PPRRETVSDVNTEAGFDAALAAQVAKSGEVDTEEPQPHDPSRDSTSDILSSFGVVHEAVGPTVKEGLSVGPPELPGPSIREQADAAIAELARQKESDPGWQEFEARKAADAEARAESFGTAAELRGREFAEALTEAAGDITNPTVV